MIKEFFIGAVALSCLTSSVIAGEINATLSSRYDVFPEHNSGTDDKSRSAEVKVEAFHDFNKSRVVAELIGRADADDAGRRIIEARQAYLRTPIAVWRLLSVTGSYFGEMLKAKTLLMSLTRVMRRPLKARQPN